MVSLKLGPSGVFFFQIILNINLVIHKELDESTFNLTRLEWDLTGSILKMFIIILFQFF